MKLCIRYQITGKVQGVYYRASAEEQAILLGLAGWVKNLPNGDVEVVAYGTEDQLVRLETWLWQGPPRARVIAVLREDYKNSNLPDIFEIRY